MGLPAPFMSSSSSLVTKFMKSLKCVISNNIQFLCHKIIDNYTNQNAHSYCKHLPISAATPAVMS